MARKVRRVKRSETNREETAATVRHTSGQRNSRASLREEYAYVLQDLRRILILAVIMFGLLILLNILI